jgi:hypothetical protein
MSSGGRFDSQRVQTASGTPEFYINNFIMKAVVGGNNKTGNTNAFKFEWDIYEPYSMGLLLQSLQIAARNAGYVNYLNNTPYVLRLDFVGYDELGKPYTTVKPKFFTLALTNAKFQVNEQGSVYKLEGIPYSQKGFSDSVNVAYNDVKIAPGEKGTVEEVLAGSGDSLEKVLNDIEARLVADKQIKIPDRYSIVFPTTSSDFTPNNEINKVEKATVDPNAVPKQVVKGTNTEVKIDFDKNEIGSASLGFNQGKGGTFVMKKNDDRDDKTGLIRRDKMTIDPKKRVFHFAQGQSLTAIINQIVLSSDYAKKAIDPKYKTAEGFIKWFRLDVQIEMLEYDDWTGDFARKFTYRVVQFFVHESIFTNPNSTLTGYNELQKKICKGYSYVYTGENVDVLKFDISINNLFFTGLNPSKEADTAQSSDPNTASGTAPQINKQTKTDKGSSTAAQFASGGRARLKRDAEILKEEAKGGSSQKDTEQQVAQAFHAAFTKSNTELVTVNLEILGDPYWVVDSGFANYFAKASPTNPALTEDGTMNYESGDVYIYITFKTPVDINESTGLYDYPNGGKESPFSGIYRVTACESQFNEGQFKQKLTCIRLPGQAFDYANNPPEINQTQQVNKATSMATSVGNQEKEKISPTDDPPVTDNNTAQA